MKFVFEISRKEIQTENRKDERDLKEGKMNTTGFFERRQKNTPIDFFDRRTVQRRNQNGEAHIQRRRLASQTRRYQREPFKIDVRIAFKGKEYVGYTHDISPEGLLIFSEITLEVGTSASLQFLIGESFCRLNIPGQVLFCNPSENQPRRLNALRVKFAGMRDFEKKLLMSAVAELIVHSLTKEKSVLNVVVSEESSIPKTILNPPERTAKQSANAEAHRKSNNVRRGRKFTENPTWILEMEKELEPHKQAVLQTKLVQETSTGDLSIPQIRGWNIQFYSFIERFPQFMALTLAKAPDPAARVFLIDNLRVEKKHADQWIDMSMGFGVGREEILRASILPEVEALINWLWSINSHGSMIEGIAATNFAIEGITQGIATTMIKGFDKYHGKEGIYLDKKAYWWMEAHASYDDLHPLEALEIIKKHATTQDLQQKAKFAAQRSLEYLLRALDATYLAYAPENIERGALEKRLN